MKRLFLTVPAIAVLALALPPSFKGVAGIVLSLGGLIFAHELGHFLAAKRMGMPVEVFSLGFGPRLLGFRWKETDVRLSLLPLGGYVKLSGYNPEEPDADDPHGFLKQPYGKRMLFYSGGVLANMLVAFLLLWVVQADQARVLSSKTVAVESNRPTPGGRAELGGLKEGDLIQSLGNLRYPPATWEETVAYIQSQPEVPIPVTVIRNGQEVRLTLTPASEQGKGRLGLPPFLWVEAPQEMRPLALKDLGTGCVEAFKGTLYRTLAIGYGFWRLASFQEDPRNIGGPAAISAMAFKAAKTGWRYLFGFMAFLSINLAVLNALPIPFLDGGHMAILTFEKLRRKDLSVQLKERILTVGFVFMATLMALVIALDVWNFRR